MEEQGGMRKILTEMNQSIAVPSLPIYLIWHRAMSHCWLKALIMECV
jgi:hypothetical protein